MEMVFDLRVRAPGVLSGCAAGTWQIAHKPSLLPHPRGTRVTFNSLLNAQPSYSAPQSAPLAVFTDTSFGTVKLAI